MSDDKKNRTGFGYGCFEHAIGGGLIGLVAWIVVAAGPNIEKIAKTWTILRVWDAAGAWIATGVLAGVAFFVIMWFDFFGVKHKE